MHPILRIFDYQTDASLTVIGPTESYDQGGGGGERDLQQDAVRTLVGEGAYGIVYCQARHYDHCGYHYHFHGCLHLCVFTSRGR